DGIRCFHVTGVQTCALPISDEPNEAGLDPYADCAAEQLCRARTDIVAVTSIPYNSEPYWTRNLDLSASYNMQLGNGGALSVRLLDRKSVVYARGWRPAVGVS